MGYTKNHFRNLYHIAKEKGLGNALKYDWNVTNHDLDDTISDMVGMTVAVALSIPLAFYAVYKMYGKYKDLSRDEEKNKRK